MEEPQGTGTPSGGQHYREIASKLREIARECRFPGARREILDLASRLERRADDLDAKSGLAESGGDDRLGAVRLLRLITPIEHGSSLAPE